MTSLDDRLPFILNGTPRRDYNPQLDSRNVYRMAGDIVHHKSHLLLAGREGIPVDRTKHVYPGP